MRYARSIGLFPIFNAIFFAGDPIAARAQEYPHKVIRLVVQAPPGGGEDLFARVIGKNLTETWGQAVVVDNRPGAGGVLGTEIVARAAPDGYTLLMVSSRNVIAPALYKQLPYDTLKDFRATSLIATSVNILVVHPSLPVHNVSQLVELAKKQPGQLKFASSGVGSMSHVAGEAFNSMAKINAVHVPYKGSGPAEIELVGGQIQYMIDSLPPALPHVKSGKTRALATTGSVRFSGLPEIPTVAESGLVGYESKQWWGILVPAGTPQSIVLKLHGAIAHAVTLPAIKEAIVNQGAEPNSSTSPQQFMDYLGSEMAYYAKVVARAGMRAD